MEDRKVRMRREILGLPVDWRLFFVSVSTSTACGSTQQESFELSEIDSWKCLQPAVAAPRSANVAISTPQSPGLEVVFAAVLCRWRHLVLVLSRNSPF